MKLTQPLSLFVASILLLIGLTACTTAPTSEQGRTALLHEAAATVATAKTNDPTLAKLMNDADGYAVFPSVGKGAIGVGGAYGQGVLYEQGQFVGYCSLSQASIGLQLGGQAYSEIILFENKAAVDQFKGGHFAFAAQASAVALKSGAGADAKYTDGVMVFTMGEAGLMYEASIGGQKFSYQPR